jgi:thiol-disulfide isomerase/thioredoxin
MAQIYETRPDIGAQAFGTGLSQGLQALLEMKLQEVHQKESAKGISALTGMPYEKAVQIAKMSPEVLKMALPQELKNIQRNKTMEEINKEFPSQHQATTQTENELLQGVQQAGAPQQDQMQQGNIQQPKLPTYNPGETLKKMYAMGASFPEAMRGEQAAQKAAQGAKFHADKMALEVEKAAQRERLAKEKLSLRKEEKDKPYLDELAKEHVNNQTQLKTLKEMDFYNKSGKLVDPHYAAGLKLLGIDNIGALYNKESQAYKSLEVNFYPIIKELFGSRPTEWDAKQVIAKIASLVNTKEGRDLIIKAQRRAIMSKEEIYKAKREIINKNGGNVPKDIGLQASDIADKKQGQYWDQFLKDLGVSSEVFKDLPAASSYKDQIMIDDDGNKVKSDGIHWFDTTTGRRIG